MEVDESHMTEKIWSLTLEIIFLLTEETFSPVKSGDHVTIKVSPPPTLTLQRRTKRKIIEVIKKINELLTAETEIGEEELVMEDFGDIKVGNDPYKDIKVETSSCPLTPERSQLGDDGGGAAAEEMSVTSNVRCKEEESSPVIGADWKTDEDEINAHSAAGIPITGAPHSDCYSADPSCDPAVPDDLPPVSHQTEEVASHRKNLIGEKLYSCPDCGKCFAKRSNLIMHEKVHTGEKPHTCSECGKCFSRKSSLITHDKVHTGEKPYSCPDCGKYFSHKSNLTTHKKIHTGERPYLCSECGKCFSEKSHLISHENVHTGEKPYSCSECGKCYSDRSNLIIHERVHTGERPFSCSECGKCFYHKSHLVRHERVHTREKPYS